MPLALLDAGSSADDALITAGSASAGGGATAAKVAHCEMVATTPSQLPKPSCAARNAVARGAAGSRTAGVGTGSMAAAGAAVGTVATWPA